jgi:hypothetical protein
MKDNFTLKNYKRCINLAIKKNYNFLTMQEYFNSKKELKEKNIILRHDVDTQLDVALQMAKIEKERKVKSTYFIRLHSHAYNIFCIKDLRVVLDIKKLGHEIGLHYESDFYHMIGKGINDSLNKEVKILNHILDIDIKTICPHEPTRTNSFNIDNVIYHEAYNKNLLNDFKYISDSSCRWRDGTFYENLNNNHNNLYVLTHPYWWYNISPIENY